MRIAASGAVNPQKKIVYIFYQLSLCLVNTNFRTRADHASLFTQELYPDEFEVIHPTDHNRAIFISVFSVNVIFCEDSAVASEYMYLFQKFNKFN